MLAFYVIRIVHNFWWCLIFVVISDVLDQSFIFDPHLRCITMRSRFFALNWQKAHCSTWNILYHTVGMRNRWNGFMDWEEEGKTELKLIIIDNWTKIDNELKRESETLAAWTKVFLNLLLPPTLLSAPPPDSLAVLLIIVLLPFTTSTLALPLLPAIWDITAIPSLVQLGTTWCNQWLVGRGQFQRNALMTNSTRNWEAKALEDHQGQDLSPMLSIATSWSE